MVSGKTLDQVLCQIAIPKAGMGLTTKQITKSLDILGVEHGRWLPNPKEIPEFCIAFLTRGANWAHVVAILDGWTYDPNPGWPIPIRVYEDYVMCKYDLQNLKCAWNGFLPILQQPVLESLVDSAVAV